VFCQEFLVVSPASCEINLIQKVVLYHTECLVDVNSQICRCFLLTAKRKWKVFLGGINSWNLFVIEFPSFFMKYDWNVMTTLCCSGFYRNSSKFIKP
jgi:hypothetical protein